MWTWTAIDTKTNLLPSWRLGAHDATNPHAFISDLSGLLANRAQLTSDGNRVYLEAAEEYLGSEVDYVMLFKQYGQIDRPSGAIRP